MCSRIEEASTIPSRFYTDPALYEASKDLIFARSWHFLGHQEMASVPGAVFPFTLLEGCLDEPLLLSRGMDDQLRLLSNVCTHRGNLVVEGPGNERFLRCRYHGRRFALDGKFQSMPEFEGVCGFPSAADDLPQVALDNWGPFLFGSLNPLAPLADVIGPATNRLGWLPLSEFRHDPAASREYVVKAHWALYVDNYLEAFHIPFIHPGLNQAIDYETYAYELFDHGNLQLAEAKPGEDSFEQPPGSPDAGRQIAAYYYWFFPNLMLNFYPWGLSVNVVRPQGPALTRVSFIRFVWRPERQARGAGAGLDRVEREDEAVVECVQKGVRSRFYDRGRFSPKREIGTHHFHTLIAKAMGGDGS